MTATGRALLAVALVVPPERRARFVEEWQSDLSAATVLGLSGWSLLLAAVRVASFLAWTRVRPVLLRQHGLLELVGVGCAVGLLLTVGDVRVEPSIPFLALLVGWRAWRLLLAWINGV